ncbi:MAG: GNAT family N-acetyltransferase [Acidihalobacter sp.]|uniref:GNAT family N-acetyltransferase n=1 Tax=Acidihalobacter sp. TaxID=1872108 RepID=UPI00307F4554
MPYSFIVTDNAEEADVKAILAPLRQFNENQAGPSGHRPLGVLLHDEGEQVVGGMWGATSYGWLFTQLLVVPEHLRGRGFGTRLMQLAEEEALARGCHDAWLDTHEFQARAFYERLGYTCFGELPDYPRGHARFFMRKSLEHATA